MQTNNRLGCLTGTGFFAALITIVVVVGVAFFSGSQMFSAGALNDQAGDNVGGVSSHAQIQDCKACHTAPWEAATMAERCVQCHQDVKAELASSNKLHGAIIQRNPALSCRECHHEHRGAFASLTDMNNALFPHDSLGFSLNGHKTTAAGQPFSCVDCHGEDVSTFASDACQNCHANIDIAFTQAHVLSYGADCLSCHDGVDRYGKNFDHNKLAFPLAGKHAGAACTSCHIDARTAVQMQSTPQDCASCHLKDDAHAGAYGTACGVCHSPDGWTPAKFDHNLASFKLEGGHATVACENCHANNVYKGTPSDCYSCHQKDDEHNGQFGTNCATCHSPIGWEVTTFDHNLSGFKLDGKHVDVACDKCHANNVFKGTPTDCYSCHKQNDEHNGQFGTDCSACHTTATWDDAVFDHSRTNFPLTGGHANVNCEKCHSNGTFKGLSTQCINCHADPGFHAGAFGTNCATCHTIFSWSPAGFNIQHPEPRTDEGGSGVFHGRATCRQCHPSTVYQASCNACHQGGFEGGEGGGGGEGGDHD